jgi:hypothetical protein
MPSRQDRGGAWLAGIPTGQPLKTSLALIRTLAALAVLAAPLLAAAPASLIHLARASAWDNTTWWITDYGGSALAVADGYAYVARPDGEVRISDISNPTNPVTVSTLTLTNAQRPSEVVVSGQNLFLRYCARSTNDAWWPSGGFHIFNVSNPTNPVHLAHYDPGHALTALEVSGAQAYVAFRNTNASPAETGVRVLDVSNSTQPVPLSDYTNAGGANGMAVLSNRLYLANAAGLTIIDVSNPQSPALLGSFQTMEGAYDVAVVGHHAYVGTGRNAELAANTGLEIIDVSNPAQPQRAGIHRTIFPLARVMVQGPLAYVIADLDPAWRAKGIPAGHTVHVFDINDPANVLQVDRNDNAGHYISDVAVADGHLIRPDQVYLSTSDGEVATSIYRIESLPAIGPELRINRGPILGVHNMGYDDFTLMRATSLTNWRPYASVFSKLEDYTLPSYELRFFVLPEGPAGFYRAAGELLTPAAMALRWKEGGLTNYQFELSYQCVFCGWGPGGYYGVVTVRDGVITSTNPNLDIFTSIEGLFELLRTAAGSADLLVVRWDNERHFPTAIDINWSVARNHASVAYRITNLVPIE